MPRTKATRVVSEHAVKGGQLSAAGRARDAKGRLLPRTPAPDAPPPPATPPPTPEPEAPPQAPPFRQLRSHWRGGLLRRTRDE